MRSLNVRLILLVLMSTWSADLFAQEQRHQGRPLWHIFDTRDTGAKRHTLDAFISDQGVLYGANDAGLISFDGVSWRIYPAGLEKPALKEVMPLANGAVLAASDLALGIYSPDTGGRLVWKPWSPNSNGPVRQISDVRTLIQDGDTIYAIADRSVFALNSDLDATEIYNGIPTGFGFITAQGFVFAVEKGLVLIVNGVAQEITLPPGWETLEPVAYFENPSKNPTILTKRSGLFNFTIIDGGLRLEPLWDILPTALESPVITAGVKTKDGSFLLGTKTGSVIHLSSSGSPLRILNTSNGFRAGEIHDLVSDRYGNAFAFFDGGVAWLSLTNYDQVWDIKNGLPESVNEITVDGASTYASTDGGLYRSLSSGRMRHVSTAGSLPVKLLERFQRSSMRGHSSVILGRDDGVFEFFNNELTEITAKRPTALFISKTQPSRMAIGTDKSINLFEFNSGTWRDMGVLGDSNEAYVSDFAESADGTLHIAFANGAVKSFAADQWLDEDNLKSVKPISIQNFPYRPSSIARPNFASFEDQIHLFFSGPPLHWDERNGEFSTDAALATEIAKLAIAPKWFSADRDEVGIWMQSDVGSFAYSPSNQVLRKLPISTNGTFEHSSIYADTELGRIAFGTPDGIVSLPSYAPPSKSELMLPPARISGIAINDEDTYLGEGPQGLVTLASSENQIIISIASLDWSVPCDDPNVMAEVTGLKDGEKGKRSLDKNCRLTLRKDMLLPGRSHLEVRLVDGSNTPLTSFVALNINVTKLWLNGGAVPAIVAALIFVALAVGRLKYRRVWPEPIRRCLAVMSGLLVATAIALMSGLVSAPMSLSVWVYWFFGLAITALLLPLFTESVLRLSERQAA